MNRLYRFISFLFNRHPVEHLIVGLIIASAEGIALLIAGYIDQTLIIAGGIGVLQHVGLASTLLGDAFLLYLALSYRKVILEFRIEETDIKNDCAAILSDLSLQSELRGNFRFLYCLFVIFGIMYFLRNLKFHIDGYSYEYWGSNVFDLPEYTFGFVANRVNSFISWVIILPFSFYVFVISTIGFLRILKRIKNSRLSRFDPFHLDRSGGWSGFSKINFIFISGVTIVYLQISLHILTFNKINEVYIVSLTIVSFLFIIISLIFFKSFSEIKSASTLLYIRGRGIHGNKDTRSERLENTKYFFQISRFDIYLAAGILLRALALATTFGKSLIGPHAMS